MVGRPPGRRGEVWLIEPDPGEDQENKTTRPCLIVSPDSMNRHLSTVTVVPLASGREEAVFRAPVTFQNKQGFLLAEQLRTTDRHRLIRRVGTVDEPTLSAALSILREMFEE